LLQLLQIKQFLESENIKTQPTTQSMVTDRLLTDTPWRRYRFMMEEVINQSHAHSFQKLLVWDKKQ
jgi:hypothetical protein